MLWIREVGAILSIAVEANPGIIVVPPTGSANLSSLNVAEVHVQLARLDSLVILILWG